MKNKTIVSVLLLVIAIAAFWGVWYFTQPTRVVTTPPITESLTHTDWKTYRDDKLQFEVKYPPNTELSNGISIDGYPYFTVPSNEVSGVSLSDSANWPIFHDIGGKYELNFPKGAKVIIPQSSAPLSTIDVNLKDLIMTDASSMPKGSLDDKSLLFNINRFGGQSFKQGNISSAKDWFDEYGMFKYIPAPYDLKKEMIINGISVYYIESHNYRISKKYMTKRYIFWKDGDVQILSIDSFDSSVLSSSTEPLTPYLRQYEALVEEIVKSFKFIN